MYFHISAKAAKAVLSMCSTYLSPDVEQHLTHADACAQTEGLSVDDMHTLKPPFDYLLTSEEHVPG